MNTLTLFWILLAITFVILEAATPGIFFFLAGAFGALASIPFSVMEYDFTIQTYAFILISMVVLAMIKYATKHLSAFKIHHNQKSNVYALVGKRAVVTTTISHHKRGYIKLNGQSWAAENIHTTVEIPVGKEVEIIAVAGAHVKVKEISITRKES